MDRIENLNGLLKNTIDIIYDTETEISAALPSLKKGVSDKELQNYFTEYSSSVSVRKQRLDQVYGELKTENNENRSEGIAGIISDGNKLSKVTSKNDAVNDAALIAVLQQMEHYSIALYGSAIAYAEKLKKFNIVTLLNKSLQDGKNRDKNLSIMANEYINELAKLQE